MKTFLVYLMLCFSLNLVSQNKLGFILHPFPKSTNNMSTIDSCIIRIWYAFNPDSIGNSNTYIDLQRLEIGTHFTKYYSHFIFNSDSLCTIWKNEHPSASTIPWGLGERGKFPYYWSEYKYSEYFIDNSKKQLTEYSRMPLRLNSYNSQSTEYIPTQNWEIGNDTISIIGYKCQKATCIFRGREYEAWFTMEIPIDKGPWKFGGLPGLILKVRDKSHLYLFECIKVEVPSQNTPIKKYDYSSYRKMDRIKLLKTQKAIHENYYKMTGMKPRTGKPLPISPPYEPLELE